MAWTAPVSFAANATLTAAQLNTYLRDNMLETEAAKAANEGSYMVVSGTNAIAERTPRFETIATGQTTASTSYVDLATVGPTITVTTGGKALVWIACQVANTGTNHTYMSLNASAGVGPEDWRSLSADVSMRLSNQIFYDGLTPGSCTFTAKYRVSAGTGTFTNRYLLVYPF